MSLLSPSAFTFAADLIGQYEGSGVGLHWSDMWSDPLPLGAILILLALDAKIYAGLAWWGLFLPGNLSSLGNKCQPCSSHTSGHPMKSL